MSKAVAGMVLVGFVYVAYVFSAALRPSDRAENESIILIELPELKPGVITTVSVANEKLFVLKPTEEQVAAIKALDPFVSDKWIDAYHENVGAYVYWAYSPKWDCPLEHKPPAPSALTQHGVEGAKWLGGYWDWRCEVSFDYAGRAISRYEYTYNGYTWNGEGLKTPRVFSKNGENYAVSAYLR